MMGPVGKKTKGVSPAAEDGGEDRDVGQVRTSEGGVVGNKDVPGPKVGKELEQVAGANPALLGNAGAFDVAARLLRTEGARAFFAGLVGRFMYAGPGFALWLPTYDLLKRVWASRASQSA